MAAHANHHLAVFEAPPVGSSPCSSARRTRHGTTDHAHRARGRLHQTGLHCRKPTAAKCIGVAADWAHAATPMWTRWRYVRPDNRMVHCDGGWHHHDQRSRREVDCSAASGLDYANSGSIICTGLSGLEWPADTVPTTPIAGNAGMRGP